MRKSETRLLWISLGFAISAITLIAIILHKDLTSFDDQIYLWLSNRWFASYQEVIGAITYLAHTKTSFILTVLAMVLLLYKKLYYHTMLLLTTMGGGVMITFILKTIIARDRPGEIAHMNIWGLFTDRISYSFPSGHAVKALLLFGVIIMVLNSELRHKIIKKLSISMLSIIIISIGIGQILLDRHFASDIIGGYIVGFAWLTFCMAVTRPLWDMVWSKINLKYLETSKI